MKQQILFLVVISVFITNQLTAQCPRQQVVTDYNTLHQTANFNNSELNWTGNTNSCTPGTMSSTVRNKHLQKINYYRKLVGGLNSNITLNATKNAKCMETVLMLKAANTLSHCTGAGGSPCNGYPCNTPNAIEGAQKSNLALVFPNWNFSDPIDNYMRDAGSFNTDVGHRRWILFASLAEIGLGTNETHNAMWVIGDAAATPTFNQFVAYPPNGFIPQPLVYDRWSFSIPGLNFGARPNFSSATVTMTDNNGAAVNLTIVARDGFFGDPSIVWEPVGVITNSSMDLTYTVTISNITNAPQSSYTYQVKIVPLVFPPNCPSGQTWNNTTCSCAAPTQQPCNNMSTTITTNVSNQTISNFDKITTTGNVAVSGTVNFQAFLDITLNSGFTVAPNNNFTAQIVPCNTGSLVETITAGNSKPPSFEQVTLNEPPLPLDNDQGLIIQTSKNFKRSRQLSITPNPLTDKTNIDFELAEMSEIQLNLIDLNGRFVRNIVPVSTYSKGKHRVPLHVLDLPTGVYYVTLQSNLGVTTKKMIIQAQQ